MPGIICCDCGINVYFIDEIYMLNDDVWLLVAFKYEILCISCFEDRLGRKLVGIDFTDCGLNKMYKHSGRLNERMKSNGH